MTLQQMIGLYSNVGQRWYQCTFLFLFFFITRIYYNQSCTMIITIQFYRISIPHPQHMPPTPKLSPLETISFFKVCESVSVLQRNFFFFFSFQATPQHMEFPGQGSDPGRSHDQSHSCNNARSLIYCTGPGIEQASQLSQEATSLIAAQRELPHSFEQIAYKL